VVFADAVSIASLYLALVGLLSTLFSVQLAQWLNHVLANESKWRQVKNRPKDRYFDSRLECYFDAVRSSSAWTVLGWVTVTLFLVIVGVFLEILRRSLKNADAVFIWFYVSLPSYIFLGIYLALSLTMLIIGYQKAKRIQKSALESL
jgi:hypothetical protein